MRRQGRLVRAGRTLRSTRGARFRGSGTVLSHRRRCTAANRRKIARTRLGRGLQDRVVGVGSIEIIPTDESYPFGLWQTVGRPKDVHAKIQATISRAKQGGLGCE